MSSSTKPFKNRSLDLARPVCVHRNLHRGGYSILQSGKVVAHTHAISLQGATFKVREAGRQKALRTGVKNVHAFVCGTICQGVHQDPGGPDDSARYSVATGFTCQGEKITRANLAILDENGLRVRGPI